jgi:fumarate reductase subunit D
LPLMAAISAAFVVALAFTGLAPLWGTGYSGGILLAAAAVLVFLVNAVYQDGRAENRSATVLRYASLVAAVVVVVLIALAAYGLLLRIQQYGLTPGRIGAAACIVVGACYGVGYLIAAARSGVLLRGLEPTNVITALVIVAVLLLLRSPFADPDRIAVADQLRRLQTGLVRPATFDFAFLRFRAGPPGVEALRQLAANAQGPEAAAVGERAAKTLAAVSPYDAGAAPPVGPEERAENITVVYPAGAALPKSFFRQDWSVIQRERSLPRCLVEQVKCNAVLIDLDGAGHPEILLFDNTASGVTGAFKTAPKGDWEFIGTIENIDCPGVRDALKSGHFSTVEPAVKDIDAAGERLRIVKRWCK